MVGAVSSDAKGLSELGMLSHEASIIATKERTEIKMIESFIQMRMKSNEKEISHGTASWQTR
jgi:hypothetical protein